MSPTTHSKRFPTLPTTTRSCKTTETDTANQVTAAHTRLPTTAMRAAGVRSRSAQAKAAIQVAAANATQVTAPSRRRVLDTNADGDGLRRRRKNLAPTKRSVVRVGC